MGRILGDRPGEASKEGGKAEAGPPQAAIPIATHGLEMASNEGSRKQSLPNGLEVDPKSEAAPS
jgi:hypothetical protein